MKKLLSILIIVVFLAFMQTSFAQDSGFLTDYSKLEDNFESGGEFIRGYIHPGGLNKLSGYEAIMIDQPEISLAADSKYKSVKPDDLVVLAESMRAVLDEKLLEDYFVVDHPGPEVLLLRTAASNLYLQKAKRGVLGYTPIGAAVHAVKQSRTNDIIKKISFVEITMEFELLDSQSGEVIAAFINQRGQRKDKQKKQKMESSSWQVLLDHFGIFGSRLNCALDNARAAETEHKDCIELFPDPEIGGS